MSAPLLIAANVHYASPYAIETWGNEEVIYVNQNFKEGGPYQVPGLTPVAPFCFVLFYTVSFYSIPLTLKSQISNLKS